MRGDSDDLGTAAVARFQPGSSSGRTACSTGSAWRCGPTGGAEEAARQQAAAGCGASLADAAAGAAIAARLLFGGITAVKNAAVRNPKTAITAMLVAGLAGWYCHRRGWITGAHLRAAVQQAASAARPFAQCVAAADARCNEARAALTVVEGLEPPSLEERCARHLGPAQDGYDSRRTGCHAQPQRSGRHRRRGRRRTGSAPRVHPWRRGRLLHQQAADVRAITGGMQPADPATGTILGTAARGAGPVFTQRLPQPAAL